MSQTSLKEQQPKVQVIHRRFKVLVIRESRRFKPSASCSHVTSWTVVINMWRLCHECMWCSNTGYLLIVLLVDMPLCLTWRIVIVPKYIYITFWLVHYLYQKTNPWTTSSYQVHTGLGIWIFRLRYISTMK